MPVIGRQVTAANANVLANLRFTNNSRPAAVSGWFSSATAGESFSFGVGDVLVAEDVEMNLESANQVVDTSRDQRLFQELIPPGQMVLSIPAVATDSSYLLNIELL